SSDDAAPGIPVNRIVINFCVRGSAASVDAITGITSNDVSVSLIVVTTSEKHSGSTLRIAMRTIVVNLAVSNRYIVRRRSEIIPYVNPIPAVVVNLYLLEKMVVASNIHAIVSLMHCWITSRIGV